jgi:hypothetical protein
MQRRQYGFLDVKCTIDQSCKQKQCISCSDLENRSAVPSKRHVEIVFDDPKMSDHGKQYKDAVQSQLVSMQAVTQ